MLLSRGNVIVISSFLTVDVTLSEFAFALPICFDGTELPSKANYCK